MSRRKITITDCGHTPLMHETHINDTIRRTCCHCHVLIDKQPPADWHNGCMRAYGMREPADRNRNTPDTNTIRDALVLIVRSGHRQRPEYAALVALWERMTGYDWNYHLSRNYNL